LKHRLFAADTDDRSQAANSTSLPENPMLPARLRDHGVQLASVLGDPGKPVAGGRLSHF